jgi:hypothetical protein
MKSGTTSAAIVGTVVGIALGVWIGVEMTTARDASTQQAAAVQPVEAPAPAPVAEPVKAKRAGRVARVTPKADTTLASAESTESAPKLVMTIPVTAPELHNRIKPVLARGTKIPMAVEGFRDAEQFATVAHAARNTQVPFILLKHRVLTEGQSLADAIRASKPDLDAQSEVERARSAAKSDLAALSNSAASE